MARSPLIRDTVYGPVEGIEDAGAYSWKGIPFAKPPMGALRWKAPVEPDAWTSVRSAKTFGPASAQYGRLYGPGANNRYDATVGETLNQAVGSEDCLSLNIWRPAHDAVGLPVIYFIYGGSNVSGYTADPLYDGANLAKAANAVVVTANYRLGILGWFNMPALKTGDDPLSDSGNFGTLDQVQVLTFINRNIAQFGGDPGNVTVMGESAGAVNTFALLTSPLLVDQPPLFHRAVPLSSGLATADELAPGSVPTMLPTSFSEAQSAKLLACLLVADGKAADEAAATAYAAMLSNAQIADYMRSKTTAELFTQMLTKLGPAGLGTASHIPDGLVVANTAVAAIKAGRYLKVPVLAGNTRDEGRLFFHFLALPAFGGTDGVIISDADRFKLMMHYDPDAVPAVGLADLINPVYLPVGTPETGYHDRSAAFGKALFDNNRDTMLDALKASQPHVWHYQFDWDKEPAPWNDFYGAAHLFDLFFVFGNFGPSLLANIVGGKANETGRQALSAAMMKAIGAFARTGDPNTPELGVAWPTWPKRLHFDASLTDKVITVT